MKSLLLLFLTTCIVTLAPHREENETDMAFFMKTFYVFPPLMRKKIRDEIFSYSSNQKNPIVFYTEANQQEQDYNFAISSFLENKVFLKYKRQTREIPLITAQEALTKLKAP